MSAGELAPVETVNVIIDDVSIAVPKGTLIIRAAEQLGVQIPRFCDHPLLDPVGACRECIVHVEGMPKPVTACTTTVTDGMVVKSQLTSPVAAKAQAGTLEMLLINHPLDCPVCDKGGECPLQNQALSNGYAQSRFRDEKRTFAKPIAISSQVLLDRERCVLCARCTRFSQQIAGDPFIELFERGALEQVAIYTDEPFESYFSGNTIQICPVGALTSAAYRFRARPFDLVSTPSVCEHCASGCAQRTDWRRGKVMRRLAGNDPEVNEEWNCDKGRFAFRYATAEDRLHTPLVRNADGYLVETSWTEALAKAAQGLADAARNGGVGVLPGGRLTVEDAYAYGKFARTVLGTNDIDFRARPHSAEELGFLAHAVAGRYTETTYADLEAAPAVLLAGFEPQEESPIVFLRLRKTARKKRLQLFALAPFVTPSVTKSFGRLIQAVPGAEAAILGDLAGTSAKDHGDAAAAAAEALRSPGAVILVGERLATVPGALSAAVALAAATGARLAWVPRRAGDRGAVDAGALPTLLPGGRPLADPGAREAVSAAWGAEVPAVPGRQLSEIVAAARDGSLGGLLVGGVDPDDLPDPAAAYAALAAASFIVSLEIRRSAVTERADVVFPVAPPVEKSGSYLDWEGRPRIFEASLRNTGALDDGRVLHVLAATAGVDLGLPDVDAARAEISRLGAWGGPIPPAPTVSLAPLPAPNAGTAVLATWHWLLDCGRLQEGEPYLGGTAKNPRLHLSPVTAAEIGASAGDSITVSSERGTITLPLVLADLPDRVVWLPTNSPGSQVRSALGVDAGAVVGISTWGSV
ncbi:MAG: NADH-quinone oxidoreductase subunit G [Frankiaceae bacterium]